MARVPSFKRDAFAVVEGMGLERQALHVQRAGEISLGERRALIGRVGLLADDGERARKALAAQRGRGLQGGLARADDQDPCRHAVRKAGYDGEGYEEAVGESRVGAGPCIVRRRGAPVSMALMPADQVGEQGA